MTQRLLVGSRSGGKVYRLGYDQPDDDGTPALFSSVSQVFAAPDWTSEMTMRFLTVILSANAGLSLRLTPILEGNVLDGSAGQPDCRVDFAIPVPVGATRTTVRVKVGLFNRIRLAAGEDFGRTGFRGTWAQFRVEMLTAPVLPSGETTVDVRFDGVAVDYTPRRTRAPTVGPT